MPSPPDFVIVGAPKCGTTALDHYLGQHPDIFMAPKELHYFGADLGSPLHGHLDRYLAHFRDAGPGQHTGESSVWYLYSKDAAREIHAHNPDCRVLVMLRQPADAMYSQYHYYLARGREPLTTFEAALDAEADRRQGRRIPTTVDPAPDFELFYRDAFRFTEPLKRYFDVFGRDRVRVMLLDDLKARPRETYRDTLAFLGVDPSFEPSFEPRNVGYQRRVRRPRLRDVVRNPLTIRAARWLKASGRGQYVEHAAKLLHRVASTREAVPALDPNVRVRLTREMEPDIRSLERLLDRDLSAWRLEGG